MDVSSPPEYASTMVPFPMMDTPYEYLYRYGLSVYIFSDINVTSKKEVLRLLCKCVDFELSLNDCIRIINAL